MLTPFLLATTLLLLLFLSPAILSDPITTTTTTILPLDLFKTTSQQYNSIHSTISETSALLESIRVADIPNSPIDNTNLNTRKQFLQTRTTLYRTSLQSSRIKERLAQWENRILREEKNLGSYEQEGAVAFAKRSIRQLSQVWDPLKLEMMKLKEGIMESQTGLSQFLDIVEKRVGNTNDIYSRWAVATLGIIMAVIGFTTSFIMVFGNVAIQLGDYLCWKFFEIPMDTQSKPSTTRTNTWINLWIAQKRGMTAWKTVSQLFSTDIKTWIWIGVIGTSISMGITYSTQTTINTNRTKLFTALNSLPSKLDTVLKTYETFDTKMHIFHEELQLILNTRYEDHFGFTNTMRGAMIAYTTSATNFESENSLTLTKIMDITTQRTAPLRSLRKAIGDSDFLSQIPETKSLVSKMDRVIEMRTSLDMEILRLMDRMMLADTHFLTQLELIKTFIRNGQTPLALHAILDNKSRQKDHEKRLKDIMEVTWTVKHETTEAHEILITIEQKLDSAGKATKWEKLKNWARTTVLGMSFAYFSPSNSFVAMVVTVLSNLVTDYQLSTKSSTIQSNAELTQRTEPYLFQIEAVAREILETTSAINAQIEDIVLSSTQAEERFEDVSQRGEYDDYEIKYLETGLEFLERALRKKLGVYQGVLVVPEREQVEQVEQKKEIEQS